MEFRMEKYANFVVVWLLLRRWRLWSAYEGVLKVQSNGSALTEKRSAKNTTSKHPKREWQTTKFNSIMTSKRGKCNERRKKLAWKTHTHAQNHINKSWMQREVEWNKLNLHIDMCVYSFSGCTAQTHFAHRNCIVSRAIYVEGKHPVPCNGRTASFSRMRIISKGFKCSIKVRERTHYCNNLKYIKYTKFYGGRRASKRAGGCIPAAAYCKFFDILLLSVVNDTLDSFKSNNDASIDE